MKSKTASAGLITEAQAKKFWVFLDKWQEKLNLRNWIIVHSPEPAHKAQAMITKIQWKQQQCTCRIGLDWGALPIDDADLERTAAHELLHILLHELNTVATQPGVSQDDVLAAEHRVINVLEPLLVPKRK